MNTIIKPSPFKRFFRFMNASRQSDSTPFETWGKLHETQVSYSSTSLQFILVLAAASCIATLGLIVDSSVTIVGAMLIAPAMKPIMASSYGLVTAIAPFLFALLLRLQ